MRRSTYLLLALLFFTFVSTSSARNRRWENYVVAKGSRRAQIKATNILYRPNRPLHFYGNTTRRLHYENRLFPSLREVGEGVMAFIRK